ncbi:MAG: signal peptidase I [Clostridia bacterium]|nr:signal peptidase I [Clostridia bacterium]
MDENQISYEEIDREMQERAAAKRRRLPHEIFDFAELILVTLALLVLVTTLFIRQTVVVGGSMEPTLKNGEQLFISDLFYTPKAGDIVVVQVDGEIAERFTTLHENEAIIKRVIATEGQTVGIVNGTVYIDGVPLSEDYVLRDGTDQKLNMPTVTVSEGHIFLMGDHRNNSLDSRWFGEVDERTVIGKILFRFLPLSQFGGVN